MKTFAACMLGLLIGCGAPANAPAAGDAHVTIDEVIGATAHDDATLAATKNFYAFWNTGDEALARAAVSPSFVDRTLPPGRPQGPDGPLFASKHFRAAVPDLGVEVRKLIVTGDYVTVHREFRGHFTGTFETTAGKGEEIRITDNWHLEDNLTLLKQLGVVP